MSLEELEKQMAKADFWYAIKMGILVGIGVLIIGTLAS